MIHPVIKKKLENYNEYLSKHGNSFTNSSIVIENSLNILGDINNYAVNFFWEDSGHMLFRGCKLTNDSLDEKILEINFDSSISKGSESNELQKTSPLVSVP